jgi:transposase
MLSAIQCNPLFKTTYHRLVEAGKPKKIAIIACVRK